MSVKLTIAGYEKSASAAAIEGQLEEIKALLRTQPQPTAKE